MSSNSVQIRVRRRRLRTLRRARLYIRANEGALARVLNTYSEAVKSDPSRQLWLDE
jgi:hypothetical protein